MRDTSESSLFVFLIVFMVLGCKAPPVVSNSRIEGGDQFIEGNEIVYVCNQNFKLIGNNKSICKSGQWTIDGGELPRCERGEIITV